MKCLLKSKLQVQAVNLLDIINTEFLKLSQLKQFNQRSNFTTLNTETYTLIFIVVLVIITLH